jgi:signal peptidase II
MDSSTISEAESKEKIAQPPIADGLRSYAVLLGIASLVLWLDQLSKSAVRDNLAFGESWMPLDWLAPYARILHWGNEGAAFGIFQGASGFFTVLAIVVSVLIVVYYPKIESGVWLLRVAMGLQLGGALGNLFDRLTIGYVTDFLSVGRFPVFNVADASITTGAALLLLFTWFMDGKDPEEEKLEELDVVEA